MYFWNTEKLAEEIKNGTLTENDWKNYYLATSIFLTVLIYLGEISPRSGGVTMLLIEAILVVGITIFGISFTFKSNQGKNGRNFVSRVTALSLPILIKIFLAGLLIGVSARMLLSAQLVEGGFEKIFQTVFDILSQIYYFGRINHLLKKINT